MTTKPKAKLQYAALPYRLQDGSPLVALVTSRETKRWILPKGQVEKKLPPCRVAEKEAYEEAGLTGAISTDPYGVFDSFKRLKNGREIPCQIVVFLLEVTTELDKWPEQDQRERRWCSPGEAALLASEPGLVQLLLDFSGTFD